LSTARVKYLTHEVIHKTRRTATAEARVYDGDGNLVAMGTGAFRIFEKQGNPIV
jgi:acyl-coenzyme A thioesterase PaaI-like protein